MDKVKRSRVRQRKSTKQLSHKFFSVRFLHSCPTQIIRLTSYRVVCKIRFENYFLFFYVELFLLKGIKYI